MKLIFERAPYIDIKIWGWLFEIGWFQGNPLQLISFRLMDFELWDEQNYFVILEVQILKFCVLLSFDKDWEPEE